MQERHSNRRKYFDEQIYTTEKYVIPYIQSEIHIKPPFFVAEVGCGEGGNLIPFIKRDCIVWGIDKAEHKLLNAKTFFRKHNNGEVFSLTTGDILSFKDLPFGKFDLILIRDVIEHIDDVQLLFEQFKKMLKNEGAIIVIFGPWRMPFGGHQQICESKVLSRTPYLHLLPKFLFVFLLKIFGESKEKIHTLLEVRKTKISIQQFKQNARFNGFNTCKETYYLINPNYDIKFKLKPIKLPFFLNIIWFRDFFTTSYYCLLKNNG